MITNHQALKPSATTMDLKAGISKLAPEEKPILSQKLQEKRNLEPISRYIKSQNA